MRTFKETYEKLDFTEMVKKSKAKSKQKFKKRNINIRIKMSKLKCEKRSQKSEFKIKLQNKFKHKKEVIKPKDDALDVIVNPDFEKSTYNKFSMVKMTNNFKKLNKSLETKRKSKLNSNTFNKTIIYTRASCKLISIFYFILIS